MNRQFHNKRQSFTVTDKQVNMGNYSTDQKNLTGHMFNIKLEKKSYKMSFKALPVKKPAKKTGQKTDRKAQCATLPHPGADRVD